MLATTRFLFAVALLGLFFFYGCGGDSPETESEDAIPEAETEPEPEFAVLEFAADTPEAELQTVIRDVKSYLEEGNIDGMLDKYIPPDDLQTLVDEERLPRIAARYRMFKDDMIVTLKEALSLQPIFNEDTTRATYGVTTAPAPLAFVRIGDAWYFPSK